MLLPDVGEGYRSIRHHKPEESNAAAYRRQTTGAPNTCTLVQALRLWTGRTAHRWSRGIALLFLDHGTRRGWEVNVTPRPLFTPGKDPVPIVQEVGWAPGPVWTDAENLAPTGIRSPDRPARSQSLYRLSYPAHCPQYVQNIKILWVVSYCIPLVWRKAVFWICSVSSGRKTLIIIGGHLIIECRGPDWGVGGATDRLSTSVSQLLYPFGTGILHLKFSTFCM